MKALKYLAVATVITLGFTACEKKAEIKRTIDEEEVKTILKPMTLSERLAYDKAMNNQINYFQAKITDQTSSLKAGSQPINIILLSFDGWGRLAKGSGKNKCGGWGLCDVVWFPNRGYEVTTGSILEYDVAKDEFYFDVLLSEEAPSDISSESFDFHIDEDIFIDTKDVTGKSLSVQKGVYQLDESLGSAGGYRIAVKE